LPLAVNEGSGAVPFPVRRRIVSFVVSCGKIAIATDSPTYSAEIKRLFREQDRRAMTFAFDLWDYRDVAGHAAEILGRLRDGSMPCDGAWPEERIDLFQRWLESGTPA
jgi:hypothetical protein